MEELWTLAKSRAEKAGHKEDFAYVMGILKRMLGLTEKFRSEDAVLLAEALGPEVAGKIAAEGLPGDVREAARKAWGRVEATAKGLRSGATGWDAFYAVLGEVVGIVSARRESVSRNDRSMVGVV